MSRGRNTVVIGVRVADDVYARVKKLAAKEGWTVNDWMKSVILRRIGRQPDDSICKHPKGCSEASGDGVVNTNGKRNL